MMMKVNQQQIEHVEKELHDEKEHQNDHQNDLQNVINFLKELGMLIRVGENTTSEHVIKLIGFCTTATNPTVIVELACGSLEEYLKKKAKFERPQTQCCDKKEHEMYIDDGGKCNLCQMPPLTNDDRVDFAKQITTGMLFLASKRVVHRDLAARNILVKHT